MRKRMMVIFFIVLLAACGNGDNQGVGVESGGDGGETAVLQPTPEPTESPAQIPKPTAIPSKVQEPMPTPTEALEAEQEELVLQKAQEFQALATYNIGLGDLDGDGDLDAVFANMRFNKSRVWLNDGQGNFEQTPQELTQQGHGVALDDLDGDGDLDAVIVCATFNNNPKPTKIYFNDGSGNFTDSMQDLDDLALSGGEVNLIDIENDGDMDIHIYYYPGKNIIYLNDGDGNFSDKAELMRGTIGWGDLNTDGSVDIFLKDHENEKVYQTFLNDGTGKFTELWQMHDANIAERKVLIADFDADGDLDAFTTNGDRDQQHPSIMLFNNGDGTFEDSGQSLGVTHMAHPIEGDLNGDGFLDIFIANGWMYDQILINDGHGFFTDSGLILDENLHSTLPSLGDLDMDGDLDIMVGSYESKPNYWFNETNTSLQNAYLGQTPPGNTPELFAPEFISTESAVEFSATFSPDGSEFFFTRRQPGAGNQLFYTRLEDGVWTTPQLAPFNADFAGAEAIISPDGNTLYFMSTRPLSDETNAEGVPNYWTSTRTVEGWAEPEYLGSDMMYVSQASNGTIYFTDVSTHGQQFIVNQVFSDDAYSERERVEISAANFRNNSHPFIAPDESYLIFNATASGSENTDLFIMFKMEDGAWSEPVSLGNEINTEHGELTSMVTPDGQYLFFARFINGTSDIYWVSADIIEQLRP